MYEGEMYGKSNMDIYITICKTDDQWEFAIWLRKLKQGLCVNLEGWNGEGDGREVQMGGDICIPTAPHSSVLAWRIPGTGEPGGLPSMGSHRDGHD